MNTDFKYLLDGSFDPASRVWVYQASRLFSLQEALQIEESLHQFTAAWKSHGAQVKGAAYLFFGQFIILMADERATGVSGCSTDSSVHLIKQVEKEYDVNMFDRTILTFVKNEKLERLPMSQLQYGVDNGFITAETLFFNNSVQTKEELENSWLIPVGKSWLGSRIKLSDAKS